MGMSANKSLGMRDYPGQSGTDAGQTPCLLGFFMAPPADGGSRLLVGVFRRFGDFRGGFKAVLTPKCVNLHDRR